LIAVRALVRWRWDPLMRAAGAEPFAVVIGQAADEVVGPRTAASSTRRGTWELVAA